MEKARGLDGGRDEVGAGVFYIYIGLAEPESSKQSEGQAEGGPTKEYLVLWSRRFAAGERGACNIELIV